MMFSSSQMNCHCNLRKIVGPFLKCTLSRTQGIDLTGWCVYMLSRLQNYLHYDKISSWTVHNQQMHLIVSFWNRSTIAKYCVHSKNRNVSIVLLHEKLHRQLRTKISPKGKGLFSELSTFGGCLKHSAIQGCCLCVYGRVWCNCV